VCVYVCPYLSTCEAHALSVACLALPYFSTLTHKLHDLLNTKCCEVLQCNEGTSNKMSNIIMRLLDNRKLLLICILLLLRSLVFF